MKYLLIFIISINLSCVSKPKLKKSSKVYTQEVSTFFKNKQPLNITKLYHKNNSRKPQSESNDFKIIEKTLNQAGLNCPDKIWPNFSWKNKAAVIAIDGEEKAYMWKSTTNKFEEQDYYSLPEDALYEDYADIEINNIRAASALKYDDEDISITGDTLYHEAFHFWGQEDNWNSEIQDPTRVLRGTPVPIISEPREIRAMIYYRLKEFLLHSNEVDLNKAAYWYKKWKSKYPKEADKVYDREEGSAQYVTYMYKAIGKVGCNVDQKSIVDEVKKIFQNQIEYPGIGLDNEAYELGALSGIILDLQKIEWKSIVTNSQKSSLKLLLDSRDTENDEIDEPFIKEVRAQIKYFKKMYNPIFGDLGSKFNNSSSLKVFIPGSWEIGVMSMIMAIPKEIPGTYSTAFIKKAKFKDPTNGNNYLKLNKKVPTINYVIQDNPCKSFDGGFYVIIDSNEINKVKLQGDKITYKGKTGKLSGEIKTTESHPTLGKIYCLN